MANTYRKVYLHIVFAVKNRKALLHQSFRDEIFSYLAETLSQKGHYALAVNGTKDHVHLFFDYNCKELIEDIVRELKKASTKLIQEKHNEPNFKWQSGYGVFSHGFREKDAIIKYIVNQEAHHRKRTFKEEYLALLEAFQIEFNDKYAFDFID